RARTDEQNIGRPSERAVMNGNKRSEETVSQRCVCIHYYKRAVDIHRARTERPQQRTLQIQKRAATRQEDKVGIGSQTAATDLEEAITPMSNNVRPSLDLQQASAERH